MASLLVLAIILYTVSVNAEASQDQLVSVYIHYRHGDRTPLHSFPEDKYFNPTNFPMGYGQLTTSGMQRQYMLGYWLRQRYTNFLPAIYSRDDIYIFATDTDRTLMSAYCCLAALYPPINQQVWNPYILWQPIPVHSRPKKTDIIITNKRPCKRYQKLLEEEKTSAFFNNINKENFKLYSYLSYKSGLNVTDVQKVKLIWGNLHIYYHYNKNFIPKWANKLDTKQMVYLSGLAFQRFTFSEEMKRFGIGPFYDHLFTYFNNIVNNTVNTPRMMMISGHDTSLASAMNSMGAFTPHAPDFSAALLWELMRRKDGSYYINVLYRTETDLQKLTVAGCDFDCNYTTFVNIMKPRTVDIDTWLTECEK